MTMPLDPRILSDPEYMGRTIMSMQLRMAEVEGMLGLHMGPDAGVAGQQNPHASNFGTFALTTTPTKTISSGTINIDNLLITQGPIPRLIDIKVDTEGAAASDDLDSVNFVTSALYGARAGQTVLLRLANTSRAVTLKNGTGNLTLSSDYIMDQATSTMLLVTDGTNWLEVARGVVDVPTYHDSRYTTGFRKAYSHFGAANDETEIDPILGGLASFGGGFQNFDATNNLFYYQRGGGSTHYLRGSIRSAYPTGQYGAATGLNPATQIGTPTKCVLEFYARFVTNSYTYTDESTYWAGIGWSDQNSFTNMSGYEWIVMSKNTDPAWVLACNDGTTISTAAGGTTADTNWHKFKLEWATNLVTLYVDGVSYLTRSTSIPDNVLSFQIYNNAAVNSAADIDLVDAIQYWE